MGFTAAMPPDTAAPGKITLCQCHGRIYLYRTVLLRKQAASLLQIPVRLHLFSMIPCLYHQTGGPKVIPLSLHQRINKRCLTAEFGSRRIRTIPRLIKHRSGKQAAFPVKLITPPGNIPIPGQRLAAGGGERRLGPGGVPQSPQRPALSVSARPHLRPGAVRRPPAPAAGEPHCGGGLRRLPPGRHGGYPGTDAAGHGAVKAGTFFSLSPSKRTGGV